MFFCITFSSKPVTLSIIIYLSASYIKSIKQLFFCVIFFLARIPLYNI